MKGFKTLAFNALVIVLGALLPWAAGIDWTQYVSPNVAALIVAAANIGLRLMTTSAVGTATSERIEHATAGSMSADDARRVLADRHSDSK